MSRRGDWTDYIGQFSYRLSNESTVVPAQPEDVGRLCNKRGGGGPTLPEYSRPANIGVVVSCLRGLYADQRPTSFSPIGRGIFCTLRAARTSFIWIRSRLSTRQQSFLVPATECSLFFHLKRRQRTRLVGVIRTHFFLFKSSARLRPAQFPAERAVSPPTFS